MNSAEICVLLVDDEKMICDCVTAYLEDEGFSVRSAFSGEEALEIIGAVCPAVCISDLNLPRMGGEEFIVKAHTLSSATGFILHTGMLYSLSDRLRAIGMTADDVLLKPVHDLSQLVKKIRLIAASRRDS
jgi:DNA-binding response OmpR family regulator